MKEDPYITPYVKISLRLPWLTLHTCTAGGARLIPSWGNRIHMLWGMAEKKKEEKERNYLKIDKDLKTRA